MLRCQTKLSGARARPCPLATTQYRRPVIARSSQTESVTSEATSAPVIPEVQLTLRKPVGLVFAQKPTGGPVYVEEVTPGGEADKTGKVQVGDILARCSAIILKAGTEGQYAAEGYGQIPYNNFQKVDFDCKDQDFKTVMAALKSNNSRWGILDVTMVFQKPTQA